MDGTIPTPCDSKARRVRLCPLLLVVVLLIGAASLSSCSTVDGSVAGRNAVRKVVKEQCPDERIELVSVVKVGEKPTNMEYTFRSRERDLEFKANSTLVKPEWSPFYEKTIGVTYCSAIQDFYRDDVRECLKGSPYWDPENEELCIDSREDLQSLASVLAAADGICSGELAYNDEEFLTQQLWWIEEVYISKRIPDADATEGRRTTKLLGVVYLNGTKGYGELYDELCALWDRHATTSLDSPDSPTSPDPPASPAE